MPNPWIEHVKKYAKDNNISYGCAITEAKGSYVKKSSAKKSSVEVKPIEKEKDTIQEDETQLKALKDVYYEETFSISGKLPPSRRRAATNPMNMYNTLKAKLEKSTGKKYEELESFETQQKKVKKMAKKMAKEDSAKSGKPNLSAETVSEQKTTPYKKKSGVLF